MKKLIVVFILAYVAFAFSQVRPVLDFVTEFDGGHGTYRSPYFLYGNKLLWKIKQDQGGDMTGILVRTGIHLARNRSCANPYSIDKMDWSNAIDRVFRFTNAAGIYYVYAEFKSGDLVYRDKVFFQFKVPPVNSFSIPYSMPSSNVAPTPVVRVTDTSGGSGTYGDPFVISDPVVRFQIDETYDINGPNDIRFGVMYWGIQTKGHHPVYSGNQGTRDPAKTFMHYPEWLTVQAWDTRERPSKDGRYKIKLCVMDQWGEQSDSDFIHFVVKERGICESRDFDGD